MGSSSSADFSSSSSADFSSSSSVVLPDACVAKADVPKYCGEISWDNIKWNTRPDALGGCFYVFDLASISTSATYIVNGNVYQAGTRTDFGPKADGGYYIYVQPGSLSGVSATLGVKPACETGAYGLVCAVSTLPTGVEGIPITTQRPTPTLACNNGFEPSNENVDWPSWTSPAAGEHDIIATATCGSMVLQGSCGTMKIDPIMLACGTMPSGGVEGIPINQRPTLTCNNGFSATAPSYVGIDWTNPAAGEHSVTATANCGSAILQGNCGTINIDPVALTCGTVPSSGVEGVAIPANQRPTLACNNGFSATTSSYIGIDWDNPAPGSYDNIKAMANCGQRLGLQADCPGTLAVAPVTLTCGTVPSSGIEGIAIPESQRPTLTCNNNASATIPVFTGINWDNPALGIYEDGDISVTATCGTKPGLQANCPGVLDVSNEPFCEAFSLLDSFCPGVPWSDIKWNQSPVTDAVGCYYVVDITRLFVNDWNQTLFRLNGATLTTEVHTGNIASRPKVDGGYYIYFNHTNLHDMAIINVTPGTKPSCTM
jgi:hypothetical protein